MAYALHRDPTMEGAQRLEVYEKRCSVCVRSRSLRDGRLVCLSGLRFPACKQDRKTGFKLVVEG